MKKKKHKLGCGTKAFTLLLVHDKRNVFTSYMAGGSRSLMTIQTVITFRFVCQVHYSEERKWLCCNNNVIGEKTTVRVLLA